ncbi:MAG: acyl-CoA dehydrogenase family protein, partial [Candidatus Promineifilaceae bacterium]
MDFSWTEEQLEFKNAAIKFAQNQLNVDLVKRDKESVFLRESWQKCADFGVLGLAVPEKYGGSDADILTTML